MALWPITQVPARNYTSYMVDKRLGVYTWQCKLGNLSDAHKRQSQPVVIGGQIWQVVLFPRGTRHTSASVSLYIKCLLPQAHPRAVFSLAIVNDDHGKTIVKEAAHKFSPQADDWGFAAFAEQNLIYAQDAGFFSAESGRLTITLTVHLDPEVQDAQDAGLLSAATRLAAIMSDCYQKAKTAVEDKH